MSVEVYTTDAIDALPNAQSLIDDFKAYKCGNLEPTYFGRDGGYSEHADCRAYSVSHIHLKTEEAVIAKKWWQRSLPYYRTSEKHLVYCCGYYQEDHYLLIAILEPDAHAQARNNDIMAAIAEFAKKFQEQH